MDPNHNLLFALAAVAAGKVSPGQLSAAARIGGADNGSDLGERLLVAGFVTTEERETIGLRVERELMQRGGNSLAAFAALWRAAVVSPTFLDAAPDAADASAPPAPAETAERGEAGPPAQAPDSLAPGISAAATLPMQPVEPVEPEEAGPGSDDGLAVREHAGRYRELRVFAEGGMGRILLVHDTHIGRDVAFKQLVPETGEGTADAASTGLTAVPMLVRFLQEARITGQLEHPSIVPVHELGYRADGSLYYTMRLVKGRPLEEEIAARATLTERLGLLTHFLDLCQAVAYAHSRGVVHRDIRPHHVMIGAFGETVVIDWGVAAVRGVPDIHADALRAALHRMRQADAGTGESTACGPAPAPALYMPPELAAGALAAVDERSDIYALGAVLYALLTGRPPYDGASAPEFLERVAAFLPRPVRQLAPQAPGELAAICARAMARNPADRYDSAREMAQEVQRYLTGGFVSAYEYHCAELAQHFFQRHRRLINAAVFAAGMLFAAALYSYGHMYREHGFALAQQRLVAAERGRTVEALDLEERARASAENARAEADRARGRAEHDLYYANIALAQRSVQEGRTGQARTLLEAAPAALRDWEWRHLVREANADSMALRTGGMFAAFCDDGRQLVTARPNGMVVASDLATGATLRTFVVSGGHGSIAAVDAAGARLAVSSAAAVAVWNVADGRELLRFVEPGDALTRNFLSISADGRRVAALNTDRTLRVWDVDAGGVIFERSGQSQQGFDLWLSPTGGQLLLAGAELVDGGLVRSVALLDLPSGREAGAVELGDILSVHAATFSPDGATVALALSNAVQVWDAKDWKQIREISGRFAHPDTLAFSPDGSLLAAGTVDGEVILWDRTTDSERRVPRAHADAVRRVAFRPDGKWLATAGVDRVARIWECPALHPVRTLRGHDRALLSLGFNPAGDWLVTGSFDGTSRVWDLTRELHYASPRAVAVSGPGGMVAGAVDNGIALWNAESGVRTAVLDTDGVPVRMLAFDRAGARLAAVLGAGPQDRAVLLWNLSDRTAGTRIPLAAEADRVEFTGDQDQFVAVRAGSRLDMYDAVSGAAAWKLGGVVDLAFRGDGAQFAVCTLPEDPTLMREQQEVTLYDTGSWSRAAQFAVPTSFTSGLAWAPDQKRLALGAQLLSEEEWRGGAYLWNLNNPEHPQWLQGHDALVCAVAFDAAGERLATAGKDGRLVLWRLDSGTELWRIEAHGGDIQEVAFSPEGTRLATAGLDGVFKLWDAADGREVLTLSTAPVPGGNGAAGPAAMPAKVSFDPLGRYLLTATEPTLQSPLFHWTVPATLAEPSETPLQERIETWKRTGK